MESHELFKIRMDLDMTQAELSKLLGISQSHLSNLECGNRIIYPWHVEKVLQLFTNGNVGSGYIEVSKR